jgi:hypothetical protein
MKECKPNKTEEARAWEDLIIRENKLSFYCSIRKEV